MSLGSYGVRRVLGARVDRRFDGDDLANGTLVLNFVDPPTITLSLNFLTQTYSSWEDDTTLGGLTGYYEVKA